MVRFFTVTNSDAHTQYSALPQTRNSLSKKLDPRSAEASDYLRHSAARPSRAASMCQEWPRPVRCTIGHVDGQSDLWIRNWLDPSWKLVISTSVLWPCRVAPRQGCCVVLHWSKVTKADYVELLLTLCWDTSGPLSKASSPSIAGDRPTIWHIGVHCLEPTILSLATCPVLRYCFKRVAFRAGDRPARADDEEGDLTKGREEVQVVRSHSIILRYPCSLEGWSDGVCLCPVFGLGACRSTRK